MHHSLQMVEWNMDFENDDQTFLKVFDLGSGSVRVDLAAEPETAYGDDEIHYWGTHTSTADAYSFEFSSLVSSYPTAVEETHEGYNRERIAVGLVHSVVLAKRSGVERLKATRLYYDRNCISKSWILRNAFNLLLMQTNARIPEDSKLWEMFGPFGCRIPIFPYRMQMVALWDEATNWRVLQSSARRDIENSKGHVWSLLRSGNERMQRILSNVPNSVSIFDYCAKWTVKRIDKKFFVEKGLLGVGIETVRTFFAEWISGSTQEPIWEPEIPTARLELHAKGFVPIWDLNWTCQRELQRKVAKMSMCEGNLPGNGTLIMLFILGFPLLDIDIVHLGYESAQDSQESIHDSSTSFSSNTHCSIDLVVDGYRAWTSLSPQDISLEIRRNRFRDTISLRLQNDSGDARFMWQDWVDAAMGSMQGSEKSKNGEWGYGRKIVRAELREPMVELCHCTCQFMK